MWSTQRIRLQGDTVKTTDNILQKYSVYEQLMHFVDNEYKCLNDLHNLFVFSHSNIESTYNEQFYYIPNKILYPVLLGYYQNI